MRNIYFKLLKCRWKLREYDNIWRKICIEKDGKFIHRYNIDGNSKL